MISNIIFFPLLIPLITAILCYGLWEKQAIQRGVFFIGSLCNLVAAILLMVKVYQEGYLYAQVGRWIAPVGITIIADHLSAGMVLITAILTFVVFIYSKESIDEERIRFGFYPMTMFLILGVTGSFLTGDVFNLYVWFEVMLMASFVLITLGGTRRQLEGGIKYVAINFFASAIFLAGVGILYGLTGTLNMADLSVKLSQIKNTGLISLAASFFFICFGIKAAMFPLYFWLPASYHTPPIGIISLIAGLLTKVGVYAFIRFFTLIFTTDMDFINILILYSAGATMLFGVLGAIVQNDFRKILSFHIISQIGYMILGLSFFSQESIAGSVFYIMHHILVKTNLFLLSGISGKINGTFDLRQSGGLYKNFPIISLLFAISAFALVGIPPLSGFWGKFMIAKAGISQGYIEFVILLLIVSIFTLFSMTKIWTEAFLKKNVLPPIFHSEGAFIKQNPFMILATVLMTLLILSISFMPEFLASYSQKASKQLLDKESYIEAVLGKKINLN